MDFIFLRPSEALGASNAVNSRIVNKNVQVAIGEAEYRHPQGQD